MLPFPPKGIDRRDAFDSQAKGTTPDAQNVRFFERATMRGRGGTRPGLTRFIDDQLPHVPFIGGGHE